MKTPLVHLYSIVVTLGAPACTLRAPACTVELQHTYISTNPQYIIMSPNNCIQVQVVIQCHTQIQAYTHMHASCNTHPLLVQCPALRSPHTHASCTHLLMHTSPPFHPLLLHSGYTHPVASYIPTPPPLGLYNTSSNHCRCSPRPGRVGVATMRVASRWLSFWCCWCTPPLFPLAAAVFLAALQ